MKKQRISIVNAGEILRMHHHQGLSMGQVAVSVNVCVSLVHLLLAKAPEAGLFWPLPDGISDRQLLAHLERKRRDSDRDSGKALTDWSTVGLELR